MRYCDTADELKACNVDSCKAAAGVPIARLVLAAFVRAESVPQHQKRLHMHSLDVACWK